MNTLSPGDHVVCFDTGHFAALWAKMAKGFDLKVDLLPGEFEGSLPELARWINKHVKNPNGEVLMGGEIVDGQAKGVVKADEKTTVAQAIEQFAKSSRTSPYVIILDMLNPFTGTFVDEPRAWRGAYLQDLAEWRSQPGDLRFDGVIRDEKGALAK